MTPAPAYSPDPTLTPQQHRIITLLAAGSSITEAAAAENIHRNTVGYWRRTIPAFARELEIALRERRQYWHEQATLLVPQALEVIQATLTDPASSPSLRFRAAALILKMTTDAPKPPAPLLHELEAVSGQMHEKLGFVQPQMLQAAQSCTKPTGFAPEEETFDIRQAAKIAVAAQNRTMTTPQPIRVIPQPGRNELCSCGSGMKFKRCCIGKAA